MRGRCHPPVGKGDRDGLGGMDRIKMMGMGREAKKREKGEREGKKRREM